MAQPGLTTQLFVQVDNIRNDVVVTKRGGLRAILHISSMNFALKSREEQEAVIYEYQNFLNSLDFPIQILINSRLINVDDYLKTLRATLQKQESQLLGMQTQEYIKFIQTFVEEANIVSTDFYVVVPFNLIETEVRRGGAAERFKMLFGKGSQMSLATPEKFMYNRGQLMQRVDFVSSGLQRLGLVVRVLKTEELISLFWGLYNAGDLKRRGLLKPLFG